MTWKMNFSVAYMYMLPKSFFQVQIIWWRRRRYIFFHSVFAVTNRVVSLLKLKIIANSNSLSNFLIFVPIERLLFFTIFFIAKVRFYNHLLASCPINTDRVGIFAIFGVVLRVHIARYFEGRIAFVIYFGELVALCRGKKEPFKVRICRIYVLAVSTAI